MSMSFIINQPGIFLKNKYGSFIFYSFSFVNWLFMFFAHFLNFELLPKF